MSTGGIVGSKYSPIQSEKPLGPISVQEPGCGAGLGGQGALLQSGSHFVIVCHDSGARIHES